MSEGAVLRQTVAVEHIPKLVNQLRENYSNFKSFDIKWRKQQLNNILTFVKDLKEEIIEALHADLHRPRTNSESEIVAIIDDVRTCLENIDEWSKPIKQGVALLSKPGSTQLVPEPLGVVLVIGAWNFPVVLLLQPFIGALAAGNAVILKPSEVSVHTSNLMTKYVPKYFDPDFVQIIPGGVEHTTALLQEKFDHIFYTGSGSVGRIVMAAAAKHLTPVTLELGGKSPTIIARDADLAMAARRIIWAKLTNAGQLCIAPDYALVEKPVAEKFINLLVQTIKQFYGDPKSSPDLERIVNSKHLARLRNLLKGQEIYHGGEVDEEQNYMAPTIVLNPDDNSALMQDEIFGPILIVKTIDSISEAIKFINQKPKPLALYIFSSSKSIQDNIIKKTSSGGVVVNDCVLHVMNPLPFGGVGESGMGAYHGKYSFTTFTHYKPVLRASTLMDPDIRYPPYTPQKLKWMIFLTQTLQPSTISRVLSVVAVALCANVLYFLYHHSDELPLPTLSWK